MDINKAKVSIIIPVYNVREYLKQCLTSIIGQTLKNIEIIVIDDGSTDGSGQICDDFAEKDSRIAVVHKNNEGLSAARNDGLNIAKAEYVMFVDSDDWVEPDFCKTPYQIAKETDSEIVIFQRIWHSVTEVKFQLPFPKEGIVSKQDVLTDLWSLIGVISWNKLYKRELFSDIRFPVGRLCEDNAVTHCVIHKAKSVYLLNKSLYHHRTTRPGSIMVENSDKKVKDEACLSMLRVSDLRKWNYISSDEEARHALTYLIRMGHNQELSAYCEEIVKESRTIGSEATWKQKILFRIYKNLPVLFDFILILIGKRYKQKEHEA